MEVKDSQESPSDRGDTPSASKLAAISLCRGHHLANKLFPWYGERSEANEGTIRHELEENRTPIGEIEDDERRRGAIRCRQALEWCRETLGLSGSEEVMEVMDLGYASHPGHQIGREVRLWWDKAWSGQLDYLETNILDWDEEWDDDVDANTYDLTGTYVGPRRPIMPDGTKRTGLNTAFVADYKMLRGDHEPASKNVQLKAQAALVVKNYPTINVVNVALIEPFQEPTYTTASYDAECLRGFGQELSDIVEEAMQEGAPRTAGVVQCKWCSALPFCPEARAKILTVIQRIQIAK